MVDDLVSSRSENIVGAIWLIDDGGLGSFGTGLQVAQQVPASYGCLFSGCRDRKDAGGMNLTRLEWLSRRRDRQSVGG